MPSADLSVAIQAEPRLEQGDEQVRWNLATRLGFRFVFCYFVLFGPDCLAILVLFLGYDLVGRISPSLLTDAIWKKVVPWVASHLLHVHGSISSGGSDSVYEYTRVFCELVLAFVAAVVWSVLDRRRLNYRKLDQWLGWAVRLLLAGMMFSYASVKVFPLQFGSLTLSRLALRFGDLSRFDLLWGFMAASTGYTIFSGLIEALGGVLLLIPRLTTIGALVSMAALTNVFALNMAYDVPVKVLSFHLLLMSIYRAAPALPRLANVLVLNRDAPPVRVAPLSERKWLRGGAAIVHYLLGACLFGTLFWSNGRVYFKREAAANVTPPFYGIWVVDQLTVSGGASQSLFTKKLAAAWDLGPGDERWKALIFDRPNRLAIQCTNGATANAVLRLDAKKRTAELSDPYDDPAWKGTLALDQPGPQLLDVEGKVNGVPVSAKLHRLNDSKFRLMSSRFHFFSHSQ